MDQQQLLLNQAYKMGSHYFHHPIKLHHNHQDHHHDDPVTLDGIALEAGAQQVEAHVTQQADQDPEPDPVHYLF